MRRFAPLSLVLALLLPPPAPAPAAEEPAVRDVSALLRPIRERHGVPGMAGAIVTSDGLLALGADGVRRRGADAKVTVDDRWHLGSCLKAMTATLVAVLVEKGKLGFDGRVLDALPDLAADADAGWKTATLAHLLTNRSGAPKDLKPGGLWAKLRAHPGPPRAARRTLAAAVLGAPPLSPPGEEFLYSNAGFAIAGQVAETVTDTPYETLIREKLFAPLGITTAGFGAPGTADERDQPRGHRADGTPVEPGPKADNPPAIAPAGTCAMTIADWGKFVSAHLAGERGRDGVVTAKTMRRLHTPPEDAKPAYAMGWLTAERDWGGGRVLTHSGSNTMWYCVVWMAPARDFAVLVTTNQGGAAAAKAADEAASALIRSNLKGQ